MDATFIVALAIAAVIGLALVSFGTFSLSGWGIKLASITCPKCGAQLPKFRKPRSINQLLWGGWTCPACGCEIDKTGKASSRLS